MGENPSFYHGCDNCPVENISKTDVELFLKKLNERTGRNYRLPSEAEWEYAARGGNQSQGYIYAGSNDIKKVANYDQNCSDKPKKVGGKHPNELGLYDMSGNVWEWVQDVWHDNYEGAPTDGSAWVDDNSNVGVNRGGSCSYHERYHRVGNRNDDHPSRGRKVVGFRLVHDF